MLRLVDISKIYRAGDEDVPALKNVSLSFRKSEFAAILGPSGSGKSTLLNIIGGLDHATSGDLLINGVSTKEYQSRDWDAYRNTSIGFVFQSYNLIGHLSVLDNVMMALTLAGASKAVRTRQALKVLTQVGLKDKIHQKPNQLSGGQMQRVAIARALVNDPDVILADEPTGALDSETGIQVMELLKEVARERLVIMVTHNETLAHAYATRTIKIFDGMITADSDPFDGRDDEKKAPKKRVNMPLATAFSLSLKNIAKKKGRTFMTSFAGSIGIFGVAIVLAISAGMNSFITSSEESALSSTPITIAENTLRSNAEELMMESRNDVPEAYPEGTTGVTPYNEASSSDLIKKNVLTEDYVAYVKALDPSLTAAVHYSYGLSLNWLSASADGTTVTRLRSSTYGESVGATALETNYTVLAGNGYPASASEAALVVDKYNRLSSTLLSQLGITFTAEDGSLLKEVSYADLVGKTFKVIKNDDWYTCDGTLYHAPAATSYQTLYDSASAVTVTIVSVLRPNKTKANMDISYQSPGLVYTSALTDMMLQDAQESAIALAQSADSTTNLLTGQPFKSGAAYTDALAQSAWKTALASLGATTIPTEIDIYCQDFAAKDKVLDYLDAWNLGKTDEASVGYTDYSAIVMTVLRKIVDIVTNVLIVFSAISLIVSSIMIAIVTYASVIERTREIGVMRALGASKQDIANVFNSETLLIGLFSGVIGVGLTLLLSIPLNAVIEHLSSISGIAALPFTTAIVMILISMALSLVAGFIPASIASKKDPVAALRSE